jgi:hypothetical protein
MASGRRVLNGSPDCKHHHHQLQYLHSFTLPLWSLYRESYFIPHSWCTAGQEESCCKGCHANNSSGSRGKLAPPPEITKTSLLQNGQCTVETSEPQSPAVHFVHFDGQNLWFSVRIITSARGSVNPHDLKIPVPLDSLLFLAGTNACISCLRKDQWRKNETVIRTNLAESQQVHLLITVHEEHVLYNQYTTPSLHTSTPTPLHPLHQYSETAHSPKSVSRTS